MKILIDLYKLKNPYNGLGQFSIQLAEALAQSSFDAQWTGLLPTNNSQKLPSNFHQLTANYFMQYARFCSPTFDVWHSLHQQPRHYPNSKTKQLLTIHDLNFLQTKNWLKQKKYLYQLQQNVNRADVINTISNYTKSQIEQYCDVKNKKIEVIYNGVKLIEDANAITKFDKYENYFFSIGAFLEKKNFHVLLDAMPFFTGIKLVLAGNHNTAYGTKIKQIIAAKKLENQVELVGEINQNEKIRLYKNCTAFLFPSIAEGFGMPVIEAMLYGAPVVCSNLCSLPEIAGSSASYFQSFDPKQMAETIENAITNHQNNKAENQRKIIAHGNQYNWNDAAKKYISIYKNMD